MAKKRKARPRRFFIIMLIGIGIILMGSSTNFIEKIKNLMGYGELEFKKIGTIPLNKAAVHLFNQTLMVYELSSQTLRAYGVEGQERWTFGEKIEKPIFSSTMNHLFVAEREKGKIYCIDSQGQLDWEIDLEKPVQMIQANDRGYLAIYEQEEKGTIYIYDLEKKQRGKIAVTQGVVMDMNLSKEEDIVALSIMSIINNKIESNVILYSMEGKLLGGNKYDGDIIARVYPGADQKIINVGDRKLIGFSKEKGLLWNKEIDGSISKVAWNEAGYIVLGLVNNKKMIIDTKNRNSVSIFDFQGKELGSTILKGEVLGVDTRGEKSIAFTERTLYLLQKDGLEPIEKKISNDIQSVQMISEDQLALVFQEKLETVQIKYKD